MLFTDIRLQNYRSYEDSSFELSPGVNIVVGPNAVGKTNLLEALMVASTGKSFRVKDKFLIKDGCEWLRLDVHTSDNQTRVVKIKKTQLEKTEKTFEFEDRIYKKMTQKYRQPVVLFQPDDLGLLYNQPSFRRDYFDNLIEQYEQGYSKLRNNYIRVLAQRNALLKLSAVSETQLFVWDLRLCELGSEIVMKRLGLIDSINQKITQTYSSIAGNKNIIKLEYISNINTKNYSDDLMKSLKLNIRLDKIRGYTSQGPHRDDTSFIRNDSPISSFASRGENRTLILSLKAIELELLSEKTNKTPLLLLDDVFSELDGSRRQKLTKYLEKYQTLITTTDADVILKNFTKTINKITF